MEYETFSVAGTHSDGPEPEESNVNPLFVFFVFLVVVGLAVGIYLYVSRKGGPTAIIPGVIGVPATAPNSPGQVESLSPPVLPVANSNPTKNTNSGSTSQVNTGSSQGANSGSAGASANTSDSTAATAQSQSGGTTASQTVYQNTEHGFGFDHLNDVEVENCSSTCVQLKKYKIHIDLLSKNDYTGNMAADLARLSVLYCRPASSDVQTECPSDKVYVVSFVNDKQISGYKITREKRTLEPTQTNVDTDIAYAYPLNDDSNYFAALLTVENPDYADKLADISNSFTNVGQ